MNLPVIDKDKAVKVAFLRSAFLMAWQGVYENMYEGMPLKTTYFVLTQPKANAKLSKESERTDGYAIYSLFLAPANLSGFEMCLWRTEDCTKMCLNCAGKGSLTSVQQARIRKTERLMQYPVGFFNNLILEMLKASNKHYGSPITPVMRLNGTSDLPWDQICPELFDHFGSVGWRFYDYTKSFQRARMQPWDNTFSFSGHNWKDCETLLQSGKARVAVVFDTKRGQPLPSSYRGYEVIDGDKDDLRFLDPKGVIVGLRYKVVTYNGKRMNASDWQSPFIVTT
jgi:hypothetical protein